MPRRALADGSPWHARKLTSAQVRHLRTHGCPWASRRYALSRGHDGQGTLSVWYDARGGGRTILRLTTSEQANLLRAERAWGEGV